MSEDCALLADGISQLLCPVRPASKTWTASYPRCRRIPPSIGRTSSSNSRVILAIRSRSRVSDSLANSLEDPGQPLLCDHSSTKARRILVRGLDGRTLQPTLQVRCLGEERNLRLSEQEISSL